MEQYNGKTLKEKDIYLSDNIKNKISLNKNDNVSICDEYFNIVDFYNDGNSTDEVYSLIMTKDTYKKYLLSSYNKSIAMKIDGNYSNRRICCENDNDYEILYGVYCALNNNEVALSDGFAGFFTDSLEELIGKKININLCNYGYFGKFVDEVEYEFIVKYIYSGTNTIDVLTTNEEVFKDLLFNYNNERNNHKISVNIKDKTTISKLLKNGYTHDMFFSESLQNRIDYAKPFNYVLLAVAIVLLIFIISSFINFIISLISEDSNSIGILTSFGIAKKKILIIYLIPVVLVTILMLILSIFGSLGCLSLLEYVINYKQKVKYDIFFFNFKPLLSLLLLSLLIIGLMYVILIKKLNNRTTIDLIYSRK